MPVRQTCSISQPARYSASVPVVATYIFTLLAYSRMLSEVPSYAGTCSFFGPGFAGIPSNFLSFTEPKNMMTPQSQGLQLHLWARVAKTRRTTFMACDRGGVAGSVVVSSPQFWTVPQWCFQFSWSRCPFLGSRLDNVVFRNAAEKYSKKVGQLLRCADKGTRWHCRAMWTNTWIANRINSILVSHSSQYSLLSLQPK